MKVLDTRPLDDDDLARVDAWWRAANYLAQPGPRTTPITVAVAGQAVELHPHETIAIDLRRAS